MTPYLGVMKHLIFIPLMMATPLAADQVDPPEPGTTLMQRGAEMFFQGLQSELAPALDEFEALMNDMTPQLRAFAKTMGPALADVLNQIDDWSAYEVPEILPNGDIIIRRTENLQKATDL